jgi:uncharacterized protein YktB (UPF0637 family)
MEDMSAMNYEILIRRAYNCGRYGKKGADADIFRALVREEFYVKEKPTDTKLQTKYQKKYREVKDFAIDALNQGIKRLKKMKSSKDEIDIILDHISAVQKTNDRNQLAAEIRKALDSFIELKIEMT